MSIFDSPRKKIAERVKARQQMSRIESALTRPASSYADGYKDGYRDAIRDQPSVVNEKGH